MTNPTVSNGTWLWVLLASYFDTFTVWTDSIFALLKGMCQMELAVMKTGLTIAKSCHPSEPSTDTGMINNTCHPPSDKSEASLNWIRETAVESFDFLRERGSVGSACWHLCTLSVTLFT